MHGAPYLCPHSESGRQSASCPRPSRQASPVAVAQGGLAPRAAASQGEALSGCVRVPSCSLWGPPPTCSPCRAWHPRVGNKTDCGLNVFVHGNNGSTCACGTGGSRLGPCHAWTAEGACVTPVWWAPRTGVSGKIPHSSLQLGPVCPKHTEERERRLGLGIKVPVLCRAGDRLGGLTVSLGL